MNLKHTILLFIILVGSDLLIGFIGHYSGSTGGDFTVEAFSEYIATMNIGDLALVFVIAIGIVLFLKLIWRRW